ncbi:PREDICTED: probable polygalacturonase At3g15720 [Nicotiana attenuata]|uniref:probable polygalacturonase At3g15720 n=1 Tax=Nicotiana attenuata TaxID=49451 RepID=UPI0009058D69|nr:PREDICTED: probable polygalacturonase At3g15720 [Nicotiana attenuata]
MQDMLDRVSIFLVCVTSFILHKGLAATFDVTDYGAIGDGVTDDSQAFQQAWLDVCYDCENPTMNLPSEKLFLLSPIIFQGPCNSPTINIQVLGNITAPQNLTEWVGCENDSWLYFTGISGLIINGTGQINGQGATWWNISGSAHKVSGTCHKPTAMHFNFCNDLQLSGLNLVNSSRNHISITFSTRVNISNITITAPEDSPNTDGIDLSMSTTQVQILNSTFQTGDDCISINTGCSDINITGISCGPGHGISVGSLGFNETFAAVENINVTNCTLQGTQNGVRIKTWQGGMGYARFINFENINLTNVRHPIIIDQFYCNGAHNCGIEPNAVQVSNVTYKDIFGTTPSKIAINLNCSDNCTACTNLVFEQINITSVLPEKQTRAACNNAHGQANSTLPPITCLLT